MSARHPSWAHAFPLFSIGIRFYYWPKYKHLDVHPDTGNAANIIDHGDKKLSEFYVEQKYETFQEEILNYK